MSKINREKLTRGVKLTAEHFNDPTAAIATEITNGSLNAEQLDKNIGKFNIALNFPSVESYQFDGGIAGDSVLMVPFIVPPLQDRWNTSLATNETTPYAKLKDISIGFDQMRTNGGITDQWNTSPVTNIAGTSQVDLGSAYTIELSIKEKPTERATGTILDHIPKRTIWSQVIDSSVYLGTKLRLNPTLIAGIDEVLRPYHTYVLYIKIPGIVAAVDAVGFSWTLGLPSLTVNLNCEYPLLQRDTYNVAGNLAIQNIPSIHNGVQSTTALSLDTAIPDEDITATVGVAGNGRIQTNIEAIDARILAKLKGGYDQVSQIHTSEEIRDDSTYEVIAVPMFGQWGDVRAADLNTIGLPYGPQGDYFNDTWPGIIADRRVIPLPYPFVIHNVIAVHNYYSPFCATTNKPNRVGAGSGQVPISPTFSSHIGVGIVSGLRGEDKNYQQVAELQLTVANKLLWLVDRIKQGGEPPFYGGGTIAAGGAGPGEYDMEMFQVPLVWNTSRTDFSYRDNGPPFFAGKSNMATRNRRNCGNRPFAFGGAAPGTPTTNGNELFIEVRWTMSDGASLTQENVDVVPQTTYVGNGGNWVYLIGKKALIK